MDTNKPLDKKEVLPVVAEGTPVKIKETARIVESDAVSALPGVRLPVVTLNMDKPIDTDLDIDKDTVVYLVYLLYKTNMIARNNLRNMLDEISKPLPTNVLKWLVNEAAKAGR
jgi:hypothetical protein